jgi:hypothetical protein
MCGRLSLVVWFLGPVPFKKLSGYLPFFISSSNRNGGKVFAVLSKKSLHEDRYSRERKSWLMFFIWIQDRLGKFIYMQMEITRITET